mmetsp:Transcript_45279/g.72661  ORF Transcript_45279/g.72661 Transcript_45279/m.72661 type:complete len:221 (+) Transcript_45279:1394-2056(+)
MHLPVLKFWSRELQMTMSRRFRSWRCFCRIRREGVPSVDSFFLKKSMGGPARGKDLCVHTVTCRLPRTDLFCENKNSCIIGFCLAVTLIPVLFGTRPANVKISSSIRRLQTTRCPSTQPLHHDQRTLWSYKLDPAYPSHRVDKCQSCPRSASRFFVWALVRCRPFTKQCHRKMRSSLSACTNEAWKNIKRNCLVLGVLWITSPQSTGNPKRIGAILKKNV